MMHKTRTTTAMCNVYTQTSSGTNKMSLKMS